MTISVAGITGIIPHLIISVNLKENMDVLRVFEICLGSFSNYYPFCDHPLVPMENWTAHVIHPCVEIMVLFRREPKQHASHLDNDYFTTNTN